ncbi:MAG: hypothetical protein JO110_25595, partial [Acetobacteraceae bacterium]|nr:hypothetical protein [Acetobacteraceae bacterium]
YVQERPLEAITQYRAALVRAEARDDLPAIEDFTYNIAVAQLQAGQPAAALDTVRMLRAELARRGAAGFPELDLVEATALYRTGRNTQADILAARVQSSGDANAASRASFLRGLIADDAGDVRGLNAALLALGKPLSREQEADASELQARLLLRTGHPAAARMQAESTAEQRRELIDYRGVARALALAAASAQRAGDPARAADLYLRAGRSAAAQGDSANARLWLHHAITSSTDPALLRDAQQILAHTADTGW